MKADALTEEMDAYACDPLGFAHDAYPWGKDALAQHTGPRAWQADILGVIGTHLSSETTRCQPLRIAVASGHGIGKAQPKSLLLHTPDGLRRWGDLRVGDYVFGRNGYPTRVLAIHERGVLPLYRVSFDDGSATRACGDHLWSVKGRNQRRTGVDWVTRSTSEMLLAGIKRANGKAKARQWEIPAHGAVIFAECEPLPVAPYTLGVWLGDGGRNSGRITGVDLEVIERMRELGETVTKGHSMAWGIRGLKVKLRALGVLENYSYQKSVPEIYKVACADARAEILRGLLDTDGECNKAGSVIFSSCSRELADDVVWLARSLGGKARIHPTVKMPNYPLHGVQMAGRPCWRVTLTMPHDFQCFYIDRKQKRCINAEARYLTRWIESVQPDGEEECSCISVEAKDSLYLTNDFIVTHNSALVGMIVDWAMSTCPETRVVVTANTENQLRTKTWPEIAKWVRLAVNADWWSVPAMSMYEKGHEKSWRADASPWSENNTESFAGLHNEGRRIVLIMDEASGISDKVWEVAEGALTDANTEIIWIAFGNPTRNTGRFRECFGRNKHLWVTRQIDSRTVEGVNREYLDEIVASYGEDSDFARVRVRGVFPRAGSNQYIPSDVVEEARTREVPYDTGAPLIMGVDIARFGDDKCVIRYRRGRDGRSHTPVKWRDRDTHFSANKIAEAIRETKPDAVFIDGGGVGGGVIDNLKAWGFHVIEVNFGGVAMNVADYANKRAEMWGLCGEWLKTGGIDKDQELHDDLIGPEYGFDKDGRVLLERKEDMKKRGLASPDDGDALVLTFARPVARLDMAAGLRTNRPAQASVTDAI